MQGLQEVVEAFTSRVTSPVFGSVAVAFLLWNWQAVFVLLFGEGAAPERVGAFAGGLTGLDYAVPFALGLVYLTVGPWLNLAAAIAVAKPTNMRRDLVAKWAVERAQNKAALATGLADAATEEAAAATAEAEAELKRQTAEAEVQAEKRRAELQDREAEIKKQEADAQLAQQKREAEIAEREEAAADARRKEQEILDRAQKDLEASKIENEELRAKVGRELKQQRATAKVEGSVTEEMMHNLLLEKISTNSAHLLRLARSSRDGVFEIAKVEVDNGILEMQATSGRNVRRFEINTFNGMLEELLSNSLVVKDHKSKNSYRLTPLGDQIAKKIFLG